MNIKLESQFIGWMAYDEDRFDVDDGQACGLFASGSTRQDALAELRFMFEEELIPPSRYHVSRDYAQEAIREIDRQIATHNRTDDMLKSMVAITMAQQP